MHPAWKPRGPEWAPLAPGVRWLLRPRTAYTDSIVGPQVAATMAALYTGRAGLERVRLDLDDFGDLKDLTVLAGLSDLVAAVLYAELLVEAWDGMSDLEGAPIELSPEALTEALILGSPDVGQPLFQPFMAWVNRPREPIAAEQRRLRELAKWEYSGGGSHCGGCAEVKADCAHGGTDGGELCPRVRFAPRTSPGLTAWTITRRPGLWRLAGMDGQIVGLDYGSALAVAIAEAGAAKEWLDEAGFVRCLSAIEIGALSGAADKSRTDS